MSLLDALQDCRSDAISNGEIDFAGIASFYKLNPKLVERKFFENHPTGEVQKLTTSEEYFTGKAREVLEVILKFYDIPRDAWGNIGSIHHEGREYICIKAKDDLFYGARLDNARGGYFKGIPLTEGRWFWYFTDYSNEAIQNMKSKVSE